MKSNLIKNLGLATVLATSIAANAQNPSITEQIENNYQSGRVRTEFTTQNDVETMRNTFGLAASTNNYSSHGSVAALSESFRLNNDYNFDSKEMTTSLGTVVPLKLGNAKTSTLVFGSFGEKNGFGLEETVTMGKISPSITFERNIDKDQTRVGGEVEYKAGKIKTAIGYDNISEPGKEDVSQILGRIRLDVSKSDSLGLAMVHKDYGNKTEEGVLGFWAHTSKDSPYSARAIYSFNTDSQGKDSHFGQLIFIPSSGAYTGAGGAEYFLDRRSSRGEEPFSMNITPLSVSSIQAVPVMDRTMSGLAFLVSGKHTTTKAATTDTFTGAVGYTGNLGNGKFISGIVDYTILKTPAITQESVSPRIRFDVGSFEVGARYSIPLNSQTKSALFLEAQVNF